MSVALTRRLLSVTVFTALVVAGCTTGSVFPKANRYTNEVDGISAGWPSGWERRASPLTSFSGGGVDLLTLTTFDAPFTTEAGCSHVAPAAIAAMKEGDAFFRLMTSRHLLLDRPVSSRPPSFMDAAESVEWAGGCKPPRVVALRVAFEEHDRLYEAELTAREPLDDRRRQEIETIWSALEVDPIRTGVHMAEIGRPYWHVVSTHCGVRDTRLDGRDWVAEPPISGPTGAPPDWDGPEETGTITLRDSMTAVFESRDGERSAKFRPRGPRDAYIPPCD